MSFKDFLSFEKFLSGNILKFLYWLGLVIIVMFVLASMSGSVSTMSYNGALGVLQLLVALAVGALGILLWRVICEMYLVFLSMNDRLKEIRDRLPGA
ncbi:MAG: hypothetical protein CVT73_22465 [Alphaproteobacteria bacterium HGW-Alphaproteobacteria-12]|nr:MAG: hypothetical protein CVT73_22465 [Alphaproteobacteria bacterium HGW-Alphaproteobacteria-12]